MATQGYEIKVEGYLDDDCTEWFDRWSISHDDDCSTLLTCPAADQTALHGVFTTLRDLNISVVSVRRMEA